MTIKSLIKKFTTGDSGAITLEVLALGGVLVVVGVFAVTAISDGVEHLDEDRGYQVREQDKVTTF